MTSAAEDEPAAERQLAGLCSMLVTLSPLLSLVSSAPSPVGFSLATYFSAAGSSGGFLPLSGLTSSFLRFSLKCVEEVASGGGMRTQTGKNNLTVEN